MASTETTRTKRAPWFVEFYRSAIGKKWVMAISGVMLLGYVFAHMVGNLHLYQGAFEMNEYGEFLRRLGEPIFPHTVALWILRIGLTAAFLVHIHAAYALTIENRRATPERYQSPRDWVAAGYASRTMRWSGVIVLLFVVWHLMDLTWGVGLANPDFERGLPYENLIASFSRVPVAIIYIIANLALGMHIYHGAWSLFQSVGINNPRFNAWRRYFAEGFAAVIVIGNVSFPVMVLAGVIG